MEKTVPYTPAAQADTAPRLARQTAPAELPSKPSEPSPAWNPFVREGEILERAEGTLKSIDCVSKRVFIEVNGKALPFDIDPERIMLRHNGNNTFEFTCGPQKPFHVVAEFVGSPKGSA